MITILDLPNELIGEIISEDCLDECDLFNFILVSKWFYKLGMKWLYHTLDDNFRRVQRAQRIPKQIENPQDIFMCIVLSYILTLVTHPAIQVLVKRIKMSSNNLGWTRDSIERSVKFFGLEEKYDPLLQVAEGYGLYEPSAAMLLLTHTPAVRELEFTSAQAIDIGDFLRKIVLNPTKYNFHGFPKLSHVIVTGEGVASRSGNMDGNLDFEDTAVLLNCPSLMSMIIYGADIPGDHIEHFDVGPNFDLYTYCENRRSSCQALTFVSCLMPPYAIGKILEACKGLKTFCCRWHNGPLFTPLHFDNMYEALLTQKGSLERLTLDATLSTIMDLGWNTGALGHPILTHPLGCTPLGSFKRFSKLRYLEISSFILLGYGIVDKPRRVTEDEWDKFWPDHWEYDEDEAPMIQPLQTPPLVDLIPSELETLVVKIPDSSDEVYAEGVRADLEALGKCHGMSLDAEISDWFSFRYVR